MHIEHVAIWTSNLEELRAFYCTYFGGTSGKKYENQGNGFSSYFISFESGARLELMSMPGIEPVLRSMTKQNEGFVHIAVSVGSKETVDRLTKKLVEDGYHCTEGPKLTGDGYYESQVLDPDGNRLEVTI